jgi:hypothetical protein
MQWHKDGDKQYWAGEHCVLGVLLYEMSFSAFKVPDRVVLFSVTQNRYKLFDKKIVRAKFIAAALFLGKHPNLESEFKNWIGMCKSLSATRPIPLSPLANIEQDRCIHMTSYSAEDWGGYTPDSGTRAYDSSSGKHNARLNSYLIDPE